MMLQCTKKEAELYERLRKATDKEEIKKINEELTKIINEQRKKFFNKNSLFAH